MPPGQRLDGVRAEQFNQAAGLDLRRVITRQQHAHRRTLALDHRVGRERGRQRDQVNVGEHLGRQAPQCAADALRQIERGGQALGGCYHLSRGIEQHGIGERAACVNAQQIPHRRA